MMNRILLLLFSVGTAFGVAAQPKLVLPIGHTSEIYSMDYSPDGKYIVTRADDDNTAIIWEVASGKLIHSLLENDDVTKAEYSPDGKYILTVANNTPKVWDAYTGKLLYSLEGHTKGVDAKYSADGKYILTRSWDEQQVRIWDASSGKLLQLLEGPSDTSTADFSSDGKFVFTTSYKNQTVMVWDVSSGRLLHTLKNDGKLESVICHPTQNQIVTIAENSNVAKLWDLSTGKVLKSFEGYRPTAYMNTAAFSPDGKFLITTSYEDRTAKVWDVSSGNLVHLLIGHSEIVRTAQFSSDGKYIATTAYYDNTARIWEASSGKLLHALKVSSTGLVHSIKFSPHGKYLFTATNADTTAVWDVASGKQFYSTNENVRQTEFSPNDEQISSVNYSDDNKVLIRNVVTGNLSQTLTGLGRNVNSTTYSPDGKFIIATASNNTTKVWEVSSGKIVHALKGKNGEYSGDGKYIVTASKNKALVWETSSGKLLDSLEHASMWSANFSPDGKQIATASEDGKVIVWDWRAKKMLYELAGQAIRYSRDGKLIVLSSSGGADVYNAATGKDVASMEVQQLILGSASRFSPNSKYVVSTEWLAGIVAVSDAMTGKTLHWFDGRNSDFSPDGQHIATGGKPDKQVNIWDISTGKVVHMLEGNTENVTGVQYSPDGKYLITVGGNAVVWNTSTGKAVLPINMEGSKIQSINPSWTTMISEHNSQLSLHNLQTGKELLTWIRVDSVDWVVTSPSGLFDASPGAMAKLYFVQGLDVIEFSQLKERYYEPGLWKKIMVGEKLRDVAGMRSIDLPPDIHVGAVDDKGYLPIELTNRGGGIGEVTIYIQGKEVAKDARDKNADPNASALKINYYVGNHKNLKNGENFIAVKAWNKDHWVESRSAMVSVIKAEVESIQPTAHIVTIGISDYAGDKDLDLIYAAKDAEDMSKALKLGAEKLFSAKKSFVYNLTTLRPQSEWPTKANIIKTFEKISQIAEPTDVIVVYMSGHGINVGGSDGDWLYLTQDAYTISPSAYDDPAIRERTTLSSNELVELLKRNTATKQVLIIDACASGKVVDNLIVKKDIPSSTLRALDRMKDRIGLHIITGCTADAVSYEASKYGQGVLTYSLLEGIRGAALRDEEFVDVNRLFQYAQDRVPALAEGIGGIQKPVVFSPQGSQSFDIGQLTQAEKKGVPISKIRPVYIQSNFQDEDDMSDVIGLGKKVDQLLNETASKGTDAPLIFVPVREYPDGCQLVGRYRKVNGQYVLKFKKKCEGKDSAAEVKGSNIDELSFKVVGGIEGR